MSLIAEFVKDKKIFDALMNGDEEKRSKSVKFGTESIVFAIVALAIAIALYFVEQYAIGFFSPIIESLKSSGVSDVGMVSMLPSLINMMYVIIVLLFGLLCINFFAWSVTKFIFQLKLNKKAVGYVALGISAATIIASIVMIVLSILLFA